MHTFPLVILPVHEGHYKYNCEAPNIKTYEMNLIFDLKIHHTVTSEALT